MHFPNFEIEKEQQGFIIGIDEAGRGPLAGPVVASAVGFLEYKNNDYITLLNDSKKLTYKKREFLYQKLTTDSNVQYSFSIISPKIIDKINILEATKLAMQDCAEKIKKDFTYSLIDGNQKMISENFNPIPIVKGDSKSISIAAASIIAKHSRDLIMQDLAKTHPEYSWESNAGYGTKKHIEAIKKYGITEHHRRSFAPVRGNF